MQALAGIFRELMDDFKRPELKDYLASTGEDYFIHGRFVLKRDGAGKPDSFGPVYYIGIYEAIPEGRGYRMKCLASAAVSPELAEQEWNKIAKDSRFTRGLDYLADHLERSRTMSM
ncbi:MAG: hypothetical protein HZB65_02810 [Candidatus Aenigmarchaeota archaeon]|nr:hypothetical protein [Candidatus Aenigmarchaeota archaeon]